MAQAPVRILIVDDDPVERELVSHALRQQQVAADLTHADSVDTAIALLGAASPPPQLLLVDVHMPQRNGEELIRWLREQPDLADIPAIAVSSWKERHTEEAQLAAGATAYRTRPLGLERYGAMLGELITNLVLVD